MSEPNDSFGKVVRLLTKCSPYIAVGVGPAIKEIMDELYQAGIEEGRGDEITHTT